MKVLLDENLPHELRQSLPGHDVFTVQFMKWNGVKNGLLLSQAVAADFDVFVTMDSGVPYQQNVSAIPIAIIVLRAASNDMRDLQPLISPLIKALNNAKASSVEYVE